MDDLVKDILIAAGAAVIIIVSLIGIGMFVHIGWNVGG